MAKPKVMRSFINICSNTFKTYEYDVVLNRSKTVIWNFKAINPARTKHYVVLCSPDYKTAANMVKIAIKRVPTNHKLVVITSNFTQAEIDKARTEGYTLISLQELKDYGDQLIAARERELEGTNTTSIDKENKNTGGMSLVDQVISQVDD